MILGLAEDEIWEALAEAYEKKHGVAPDLNSATMHGAEAEVTLVYTARVLVEEHEEAMLARLVPPLPKETP